MRMRFWEKHALSKKKCYMWRLGPLSIWIQKGMADEWSVAFTRNPSDEGIAIARIEKKPEDVAWTRYVCADRSSLVQFRPALPDRAVIVDSESQLKIIPYNDALFYISIPLWLQIYVGEDMDTMLCEIPAELLSNSWFGDTTEGELCYSLRSRARRELTDYMQNPHRIYCPVRVVNSAPTTLQFQKLCIHVESLRVYLAKHLLLSSELQITYTGLETPGQIVFSQDKPSIVKESTLISLERTPSSKSILKKSFSILKYFTSF